MPRRAVPSDPSIGERIQARRELRGWSIRHAASRAGIAHTTWSRIERAEFADASETQIIRRRNAAVGRHEAADRVAGARQWLPSLTSLNAEIDAYRRGFHEGHHDGYAEGLIDCLTLKAKRPPKGP